MLFTFNYHQLPPPVSQFPLGFVPPLVLERTFRDKYTGTGWMAFQSPNQQYQKNWRKKTKL